MDALRINDSDPILTPYGGVKIPTGEVGDKHITLNLIKEYVRDGDFGDLQEHIDDVNNPHNVTKDQLGLGNVDNTSDLNKPISNLTQIAINLKEDFVESGTTSQYYRGDKTWRTLNRSAVGLGNVNNTSDLNKPISNATQIALDAINTDIDNLQQAVTNITVNGSIVVHDPAVSSLIGQGTLSSPLSVNLTALNNVFVSRIELDNYVTAQEYSAHVAQNNADRATLVAADQQQAQNLNNHIFQNSVEHTNILNTLLGVANRFQMMLEFEYAIGNFYWTTRRGNPNTWLQPIIGYETFWRPVVDRILMGVDPVNGSPNQLLGNAFVTIEQLHMPNHYHVFPGDDNLAIDSAADPAGGTFGNDGAELADNRLFPYDAASTASPATGRLLRTRSTGGGFPINVLNPVYTGFCWQRYDPSAVIPVPDTEPPVETFIFINENLTGVDLYDYYVSRMGSNPQPNSSITFILAEDNYIIGSTGFLTGTAAVFSGIWPVNVNLSFVNNGLVAGLGGYGGYTDTFLFVQVSGGVGGTAFTNIETVFDSNTQTFVTNNSNAPMSIINNGVIAPGGGGGGAGANAANGGGGAPFGSVTQFRGESVGGLTTGGQGGGNGLGGISGQGGRGGDLGQNGQNGDFNGPASQGGRAGIAIINGIGAQITVTENNGTIL